MTQVIPAEQTDTNRDPANLPRRQITFAALLFLGLLGVVLALHYGTVIQVVGRWDVDGGYSHGWLILGLVAWVLWEQRETAFGPVEGPRWPFILLGLGASISWLLARLVDVQLLQQLALLAFLVLAPLMLFGFRGGLRLAGGLSLLAFTLPFWDAVSPVLQRLTVVVTDICLDMSRVSAYIVGNSVTIPSGQFRIASGCSGLHFFVSGFALSSVYSYLYLRRWKHRLLLVSVTLIIAMLANWTRVFLVILAGYLTRMQHFLVTTDHYYFGWALFGLAMVPVFFLAVRLERIEERQGVSDAVIRPSGRRSSPAVLLPCAALALVVAAAGPVAYGLVNVDACKLSWCPRTLPAVPGWDLDSSGPANWRPEFGGATSELSGTYTKGDTAIVLWVMYYPSQAQGEELVYFANRPFDPDRWMLQDKGTLPTVSDAPPAAYATLADGDGMDRTLVYWYEVGGRIATRGWQAKILQIPALLSGRADGAFVALSSRCRGDCSEARAAAGDFLAAMDRPLTEAPVVQACGKEM